MTAVVVDPSGTQSAARGAPRAPGGAPVDAGGIEARAIEATLACIARHGLTKTTIDDVAREAGCSRATLYRYFGSKHELVHRVVRSEADRITAHCRTVAAQSGTLEDAVAAVLVVAGEELARHGALRFMAEHECEILLPNLTFSGGDHFLRDASQALAPCFAPWLGDRAERAAEWIARLGLTLWFSPTAPVTLDDPDAVRAYVHEFIAPAITSGASPTVSSHQTDLPDDSRDLPEESSRDLPEERK